MATLNRYLRIRIIAAEPEKVLSKLIETNITLSDAEWVDFLTVQISIQKHDLSNVQKIIQKEGCSFQIIRKEGIFWHFLSLRKRPVLVAGVLAFLILACLLPGRIFFIEVTGNESIAENKILQQAENCGIGFAAKAADVRSENVKNVMLAQLPELQWLGITTSGSVATIHVKDRSDPKSQSDITNTVSSLVAARDGVITELNIFRGTPLVQIGQSVKAGDTLVSGYTDCGIKMTAEQADGEVFAHTMRKITVISPVSSVMRGELTREHTCFRLRIGKKVINLCNHSGIPDATCVKMYLEDFWTLPGGFQLPVSFIRVKCTFYEGESELEEENFDWMKQYASDYLRSQMIAGEVLDESLIWNLSDHFVELSGSYACHEMIGQVKHEETIEQYAKDN